MSAPPVGAVVPSGRLQRRLWSDGRRVAAQEGTKDGGSRSLQSIVHLLIISLSLSRPVRDGASFPLVVAEMCRLSLLFLRGIFHGIRNDLANVAS